MLGFDTFQNLEKVSFIFSDFQKSLHPGNPTWIPQNETLDTQNCWDALTYKFRSKLHGSISFFKKKNTNRQTKKNNLHTNDARLDPSSSRASYQRALSSNLNLLEVWSLAFKHLLFHVAPNFKDETQQFKLFSRIKTLKVATGIHVISLHPLHMIIALPCTHDEKANSRYFLRYHEQLGWNSRFIAVQTAFQHLKGVTPLKSTHSLCKNDGSKPTFPFKLVPFQGIFINFPTQASLDPQKWAILRTPAHPLRHTGSFTTLPLEGPRSFAFRFIPSDSLRSQSLQHHLWQLGTISATEKFNELDTIQMIGPWNMWISGFFKTWTCFGYLC